MKRDASPGNVQTPPAIQPEKGQTSRAEGIPPPEQSSRTARRREALNKRGTMAKTHLVGEESSVRRKSATLRRNLHTIICLAKILRGVLPTEAICDAIVLPWNVRHTETQLMHGFHPRPSLQSDTEHWVRAQKFQDNPSAPALSHNVCRRPKLLLTTIGLCVAAMKSRQS